MKQQIHSLADAVFPFVCELYKHLHAHPELSFEEAQTALFIQQELTKMCIPFKKDIGTHGIVGVLRCANPGKKCLALRADMDALPINEETNLPYKSTVANCMHACGHDAHVATLLGVAKVLSQVKDKLEGTVLFVFQPGEERHPGGARLMLQDGVFDEYKPAVILAQHASVDYPVGKVAFRSGTIMASADEVHLTVKGKGGHGALPHLFNDTVLCASQLLVSLQQIAARLHNPFQPVVLSFGKFIAAGSTNVIPDEVSLSGTLRTLDEACRKQCKTAIDTIAKQTASAYGCVCEVDISDGYPSVTNDPEVTADARRYAADFLGDSLIDELEVRMTGEDFAFFSQQFPATFYRFGVKGKSNAQCGNLHTATFEIDLDAFKTSVPVMAYLTVQFLSDK